MTPMEKKLVEKNLNLIFEFEKYVLEHPDAVRTIPRNAVVVFKMEGDRRFNRWSEKRAMDHVKKGAPVVYVTIRKLGPVHSRIEGITLEQAA